MPRVTREPGELATLMSQRLLKADAAHRAQADPLIAWASWHLNTARMGWDLFRLAVPHGDENLTGHPLHTVELAAENLIFRGVVSAMDLCAASVFRLTGEPLRADRERNVVWWFDSEGHQPWDLVPRSLEDWLRVFEHDKTWRLATELRHAFTHRTVRRHISVNLGVGVDVYLDASGTLRNAQEVMPQLVEFGLRRYSAFERALARSYPLR